MSTALPLLRVAGLSKRFGDRTVIDDVSFTVERGTVTVIIGPSGSGKTTLLRSLNALELPDAGIVSIDEFTTEFAAEPSPKIAAELRRHSAMVFQGNNLFLNKTALENVTLGPIHAQGIDRLAAEQSALELLDTVGLAEKRDAYPHQLSGGQQQRVGIARALALSPKVLLFDEPTSALDPELVGEVLATMRLLAERGWTMIVVTHEMRFARQVADDVIVIDHGRIIEHGPANEVLVAPNHPRTQAFLRTLGNTVE